MSDNLQLTESTGSSSAMARFELRAALLITMLCLGSLSLRAQSNCSAPQNPIVAENCNTGTSSSVWDIGIGGDDPSIVGFATDISVNQGQTINFKINTNASAYTMNIYRIGYYGGMGARLITSITPSVQLPQTQPACITNAATNLVDCGNWAVSASWQVPATATSGIYFVLLTRTDTGGQNHIVFVVRNDASTSNIIFQTSDESWQAYNEWQPSSTTVGHSLYGPTEVFDITNRSYKVSYNRPFHTRDFSFESATWVFGAEYPMVRWLEANGYDVTYFTGMDADRYGSLILNHKVYLSVGHDEYWSGNQRTNVEAARSAGVHLAFFSGNETFWKTRWENSIDGTSTPYRTLVCYKETYANAVIDPDDPPTWTGTWRDPRFSPPADGGRPENALHGTIFMVNGVGPDNTNLSIQVPQADGQMRFWRNTSVAALALGSTATLPAGTLGYEWDEDVDNGFRPAGLWHLSTATYPMTTDLLLDYGETYGAGTATHNMTMYRASSGALVFGAGTVQWSWGLDQNHDDPFGAANPPDPDMQQATVNLFADMGVQPATLQPGLVPATASTDTIPPTSTITSPAPGSIVQGGTGVTVSGTAVDTGGGVVAAVEVSYDGGTTWHPATGRGSWSYVWTPATTGSFTILSRAVDDSGNLETPGSGISVTASDAPCPCSIWSSSPTPGTVDSGDGSAVEVGVKFTSDQSGFITGIRFYKSAANTGTHVGNLWTSGGMLLGSAVFTGESASGWQQVNFSIPVAIAANTTYVASYHTSAGHYSDDGGFFLTAGVNNPPLHALATSVSSDGVYTYSSTSAFPTSTYAATNYWVDVVFNTTAVSPSGPAVETVFPPNGATFVSTGTSVTATFNESMNASTINATTFQLVSPTGGEGNMVVAATVSYNSATLTATLVPTQTLAYNTNYSAILVGGTNGVQDPNGNTLTANYTWTFTTVSAPGECPCTIWSPSTTPGTVDSGDASGVELGVKFTSSENGYITGIRFYKATTNTGTHVGNLWTTGGTLLASAVFTGESASGWQQVNFSSPVAITANTTYIASYYAPNGHYSDNEPFFATGGVSNPPLDALANSVSPNGVYTYGSTSAFPASTYNSTNYWVDVVFNTSVVPTVTSVSPASGATGVSAGTSVTATFNESMNPSSINTKTFTLSGGGSNPVAATVSYSGVTATLVPTQTLASSTTYTATVVGGANGVQDPNGNELTASYVWTFTTGVAVVPTVTSVSPPNGTTGVSVGTSVTATFSESMNASTINTSTFTLSSGGGPVAATVSYNSSTMTATLAPTQALAYSTAYTATVVGGASGVQDPSGDKLASNYTWTFTTAPAGTVPAVVSISPASGATGVSVGTSVTATFNESMNASTINTSTFTLSSGGGPAAATVSYSGLTATLSPTQTLAYNTAYTATVVGGASGVQDPNGDEMAANYTWTFTTAPLAVTCPCSIWSSTTTPGTVDSGDPHGVELGVKFTSSENGYITGIRFYKATTNTGTHVGNLWTTGGTLLASAVFTGESASGWQQVNFSSPVAITANTTYIASYYAPNGHYSDNEPFFATGGVSNPPLDALANSVSPNGVYTYGSTSAFPASTYDSTNYWVDVVFNTSVVPTVTSVSPASGATGVSVGTSVTATFDESMNASTINTSTFTLSSAGGPAAATVSYNSSTQTATLAPTQALTNSTTYTATVVGGASGVQDPNGDEMAANYTWTFTTTPAPGTCPCTIWSSTTTPGTVDSGDPHGVELGVNFTSSENGYITGIRFYKATTNTGTHVGNLWTTGGTLLGSAVFTGESASGWQQVNFSTPVAITANTTYIASYYAPNGHYSDNEPFFATGGVSNPPLDALANSVTPNGVYTYGSTSAFPASTYDSTNYWVDVVFNTTP